MKKFEAVSGDQSLFDLVDAYDYQSMIVKCKGGIYSTTNNSLGDEVIAERKPIEKYVPKVGDEFKPDGSALEYKCVFIDKNGVVYGENDGELNWWSDKWAFTKIDRSPNPVNMVEEKWVPNVGDRFRANGHLSVMKCVEVNNGFITGRVGVGEYRFKSTHWFNRP